MNLEKFIQQYNIDKIKELESTDPQFLALQKARKSIWNQNPDLFLYLVLQCALVGYQISWSGELWRWEFWNKITQDRDKLNNLRENDKSNNKRRYNFLTTSQYNKRIYNIKTNRLLKFEQILIHTKNFSQYQSNMIELQKQIAKTMKSKPQTKTIVFAIKMFGYACQAISKTDIAYPVYPQTISIPIDSRIKKIYFTMTPFVKGEMKGDLSDHTDTQIQTYFDHLSTKYNIAPLHLDSILWLDYRYNFYKK